MPDFSWPMQGQIWSRSKLWEEKLYVPAPHPPPLTFSMFNSNKCGLALDLKSPRGKSLLKILVGETGVVLENFTPEVLDRLGVGADMLRAENPRLIYATGTGYGISGPDRNNLAMDLTVQAIGGVMSVNGP